MSQSTPIKHDGRAVHFAIAEFLIRFYCGNKCTYP